MLTGETHRITHYGKGADYWARCICGWAWLGTYHGPKRRRSAAKADHWAHIYRREAAAHIERGDMVEYERWMSQSRTVVLKVSG